MPASREYSAGGVVVRRVASTYEIAVIKPAGRSVTALPKGHIEHGETSAQAAAREVQEETGLSVALVQKLRDVKYVYRFRGRTIFKVVSFYLFQWQAGEIDNLVASMRQEVDVAYWIDLEVAPKQLSYPGEKIVAAQAATILAPTP